MDTIAALEAQPRPTATYRALHRRTCLAHSLAPSPPIRSPITICSIPRLRIQNIGDLSDSLTEHWRHESVRVSVQTQRLPPALRNACRCALKARSARRTLLISPSPGVGLENVSPLVGYCRVRDAGGRDMACCSASFFVRSVLRRTHAGRAS